MSLLRVYDSWECDAAGVPLDMERCRVCRGTGRIVVEGQDRGHCHRCGGHGSLRAAALHFKLWGEHGWDGVSAPGPHRCEDCGHPMSGGAWEPETDRPSHILDLAFNCLARGEEPQLFEDEDHAIPAELPVHYSPCDEGCRHGGPGRIFAEHEGQQDRTTFFLEGKVPTILSRRPEASWCSVDVRTLSWPHDLRPERLAVLCLRCFAERSGTAPTSREAVRSEAPDETLSPYPRTRSTP